MVATEFDDLLHDIVTMNPWSQDDFFGTPTFGATTTYQARVEWQAEEIRTPAGELVTSKARVYIMGDPPISTRDRLQVPDGTMYPIAAIRREQDETGVHHVELMLI